MSRLTEALDRIANLDLPKRDRLGVRRLDGMAALMAAASTPMRVQPGEKHTEFVKRIVNAYLNAEEMLHEEGKR